MFHFFKSNDPGKQMRVKIKGMHCTSCAMTIDDALEDTEGVHKATTSYAKAETKVNFDPNKVSEDKLKKIISDQGYEVGS